MGIFDDVSEWLVGTYPTRESADFKVKTLYKTLESAIYKFTNGETADKIMWEQQQNIENYMRETCDARCIFDAYEKSNEYYVDTVTFFGDNDGNEILV